MRRCLCCLDPTKRAVTAKEPSPQPVKRRSAKGTATHLSTSGSPERPAGSEGAPGNATSTAHPVITISGDAFVQDSIRDSIPEAQQMPQAPDPTSTSSPEAPRTHPASFLPKLVGATGPSLLDSEDVLHSIVRVLPQQYQGCQRWDLVYSNLQHGTSMTTLYTFAKEKAPVVLLLGANPKPWKLLGAFVTEPLVPHGRKFFGTPDTRLFQFHPQFAMYQASSRDSMFTYASMDGFGVGGGGSFGIFVSGDLLSGSTGECETFCSPPLLPQGDFCIGGVELWYVH
eukprot:RCo044913